MIVHDLYRESISVALHEAYAILIIDPDAMLPCPVPSKSLQLIPRRNSQIAQVHSGIQNREPLKRPSLQIG